MNVQGVCESLRTSPLFRDEQTFREKKWLAQDLVVKFSFIRKLLLEPWCAVCLLPEVYFYQLDLIVNNAAVGDFIQICHLSEKSKFTNNEKPREGYYLLSS